MAENPNTADALINEIVQIKGRAETAARSAEEANSKANSESGFAFNAKQNAEEHAKAISQVRGTVEADFTWLTTTRKNAEESANAVTALRATSESDARIVAEARGMVEKDATTARAASDRSTTALATIEKIQTDVAAALKDVTMESAAVADAKVKAEATTTALQKLETPLAAIASKAADDGNAIAKAEADSQTLLSSINKITKTANETHDRVSEYEKELARLTVIFTELNKKIEGLLPNATSAGLASAFRNQKDRFKKPQRNWLIMFVVTITLLLIVAGLGGVSGLWSINPATPESWDEILRHFMGRLPLVAPLVWLGIYAGRNYMLALRIEEEYAFKEAVSTAFEGYKREMADISASGNNETPPLVILCENVLRALAQRPGRIYEGRHEDITPLSPVKGAIFEVKQTVNSTKTE